VSQGYLGSVTNESFDCTACQTAKQPALSFNKSTSISASPFDLVHSDIWGPAPTPTMGGSRYFVLFIDDYSIFTWIYMMKNRHELPQIYINFAKMVQTQFSKVIKVFRDIMPWNIVILNSCHFLVSRVPCLNFHVHTHLNKMVVLRESIVTFLT